MTQWFADKVLGLPELASKNGADVDKLMVYVHWLMFVLFVGWIIYFFYALYRFRQSRNPKADYVGVRIMPPTTLNSPWPALKPCCWSASPCRFGRGTWTNSRTPANPPSFKSSRSNLPGTSATPVPTACLAGKT